MNWIAADLLVSYGWPTAARPCGRGFPGFFYPLFNMAKARPQAGLTSAFRPGFDPGLPRSGRVPDARVVDDNTESGNDTLVNILWNLLVVTKKIRYIPEGFKHWKRLINPKMSLRSIVLQVWRGGVGIFGFSVLAIFTSVFRFLHWKTSVLRLCCPLRTKKITRFFGFL